MTQLIKMIAAQWKMTIREKQIWFWGIFYPVLLLVVFLSIFGGSNDEQSFSAKVVMVNSEQTSLVELPFILQSIDILEWNEQQDVSYDTAESLIKDKKVDAAIVLPAPDETQIELLFNREKQQSMTTQALMNMVQQMVTQIEHGQQQFVPSFEVQSSFVSSAHERIRYTDFLLTGMIALAISQSGMFGLVEMVEMRRSGLLRRLRMTPLNMNVYGLAGMTVRFIFSIIQVVLLGLIGILFYGAKLDVGILSFILIFTVGTLSFSAIGYLISSFSRTVESYMGVANLLSFIMMFTSGIFFEKSMMPSFIQPIMQFMPLTYFVNGVRDGLVYGASIANASVWLNIGVLGLWGAVAFGIGSYLYKGRGSLRV